MWPGDELACYDAVAPNEPAVTEMGPSSGLPARWGGTAALRRSPLPPAGDRAQNHSGAESDDDQIDDHLGGDDQPRCLGGGGDVAEADGGEHGDGEIQGVATGHGLAEATGRDGGDDHIGAGEQQQEKGTLVARASTARNPGKGEAMIERTWKVTSALSPASPITSIATAAQRAE